jgi:small subunit ribosomal protein S21
LSSDAGRVYWFVAEVADGRNLTGERNLGCMIKIKARGNESIEQMVRRFKKMCEKEGLNKEIKRNSYYEKPSERRRRRIRKSVKRDQTGGR